MAHLYHVYCTKLIEKALPLAHTGPAKGASSTIAGASLPGSNAESNENDAHDTYREDDG